MPDPTHPTRLNRRPRLNAEVYGASGYATHLTIHTHRNLRLLPRRPDLADAILAVLREVAARSRVVMYCYCLMPTHLHVVVAGQPGGKEVPEFERFFRAKVTLALKAKIAGPIWQRSFHDHIIGKDEDLPTYCRYVMNNPVKDGLVEPGKPYPWRWLSPEMGTWDG